MAPQMTISEQTASWLRRIVEGDCVVNIGQLPVETVRVLKQMTKRGQLVQAVYVGFPITKTCWIGAGLAREEWPTNVFENDPRKRGSICPVAS